MKIFIKLFSLSFLVCSVLYIFSGVASAASRTESKPLTFLVVGFDQSPSNTDVLSVVSYDGIANTIRAIQIPRDTCIRYGDKSGKINGYYSHEIIGGKTHNQALAALSDRISELLGISLDGYIAFTPNGFVDLVDYIGGVDVDSEDIPDELLKDITIESGMAHLNGESALSFVRYRKAYLRGDLDRLDAQKVFTKAMLSEIKEKRDIFSLLKFVSENDGISVNMNKGRSVSFMLENIFKAPDADLQIATLPGDAVKNSGVWYYLIKREESEALVDGYFPNNHELFDKENNFIYKF